MCPSNYSTDHTFPDASQLWITACPICGYLNPTDSYPSHGSDRSKTLLLIRNIHSIGCQRSLPFPTPIHTLFEFVFPAGQGMDRNGSTMNKPPIRSKMLDQTCSNMSRNREIQVIEICPACCLRQAFQQLPHSRSWGETGTSPHLQMTWPQFAKADIQKLLTKQIAFTLAMVGIDSVAEPKYAVH